MLRKYVADGVGTRSNVEGVEGGERGTVFW